MEEITQAEWDKMPGREKRVVWLEDLVFRYLLSGQGTEISEPNAPPALLLEGAKAVLFLRALETKCGGDHWKRLRTFIADGMFNTPNPRTSRLVSRMSGWAKAARADGTFISTKQRFPEGD